MLLQRGVNQSLGDALYEAKRNAYVSNSENLLARSLHPLAYQNNPSFRSLLERTGLPFRHYDTFGPEAQAERQELYIRVAEWVWNPSRLGVCAAGKITSSTAHQMAQNASESDGGSHRLAFLWHRSRTLYHHEVPESFCGADS